LGWFTIVLGVVVVVARITLGILSRPDLRAGWRP